MKAKLKKKKTISERRVEIAKDALAQLLAEKYKATTGTYTRLNDDFIDEIYDLDFNQEDAKKYLLKLNPNCEVCAKGAIFLSTIRKENNTTLAQLLKGKEYIEENAAKIFGKENLDRMEAVFEGWFYYTDDSEDREYTSIRQYYNTFDKEVYDFYNKYESSSTDRLKAILENVIKNRGIFKP